MTDLVRKIRSARARVAVVGDAMIDTYRYGEVSRISPEFPVPILHSDGQPDRHFPGGAANVCYQFAHLNADVHLFAPLDPEAAALLSPFCDTSGCPTLEPGSHVPRKIRYYDGDFPLLRHDIEKPGYGCTAANLAGHRREVLDNFRMSGQYDVVILSNYNKGLFDYGLAQALIETAGLTPTVVDPKDHPDWWVGCDYFKPNAAEARKMTGEADWRQQIGWLKCRACHGLARSGYVITQAGDGVVGATRDGFFEHRPRNTVKNVSSVIGAGDCFAAVFALAVAHGLPAHEASVAGFAAGCEYVKAKHNRPITPYELHRHLDPLGAKIVGLEDLRHLRGGVYSDQRWVLTNGCFDLMHPGHLATLQAAKARGNKLVVALNSDASVRALKGPTRPVLGLAERSQMLAALECVDFVVSFEEDVPYRVVDALRPHVLVKGSDYADKPISGADLVEEVFLVDCVPAASTTNIIQKIRGGA